MEFQKIIENYLAEGKTFEAFSLLLKAKEANALSPSVGQEVIMLSARFSDLEQKLRMDRIDRKDYSRERNDINWSLSELLKSTDWEGVEPPIFPATEQSPAVQTRARPAMWLWMLPVVLAAGLFYYFSVRKEETKSAEKPVSQDTAALQLPAATVTTVKSPAPVDSRSVSPTPPSSGPSATMPSNTPDTRFFDLSQKTRIGVIVWNEGGYDADVSGRVAAALNKSGGDASASVFKKAFLSEKAGGIVTQSNLKQLAASGAKQAMNTLLTIKLGALRNSGSNLPLSNAMKESGKKYMSAEIDCAFNWLNADGSGIRKQKSAVLQSGLVTENQVESVLMQKMMQMAVSQSAEFN